MEERDKLGALRLAYEDGISDALRVAATHIRVNRYYDCDGKLLNSSALHNKLAERIGSFNAQDVVAVSRSKQRERGRVYTTPTYQELDEQRAELSRAAKE